MKLTQNQQNYLMAMAAEIKLGLDPVPTYMNRDDFFNFAETDVDMMPISPEELRQLRSTPALIQSADYGRFDTVSRLTKKGWDVANELALELFEKGNGTYWDTTSFWDHVGGCMVIYAIKQKRKGELVGET